MTRYIFLFSLCGLTSCAALSEWAARPETAEGLETVAKNAPRVAVNPFDIPAWLEIVGGISLLIGGGAGGLWGFRKVKAKFNGNSKS